MLLTHCNECIPQLITNVYHDDTITLWHCCIDRDTVYASTFVNISAGSCTLMDMTKDMESALPQLLQS